MTHRGVLRVYSDTAPQSPTQTLTVSCHNIQRYSENDKRFPKTERKRRRKRRRRRVLNKRSVGIIEPPLLVSPEHRRGSRGAKTTQIINGLHSCMHTHAYTHLDTRTCCGVLCGSWLMCRLLVKCVTCLQVAQRARVCTHDRTLVAFCSFKVILLMATPHRGSVKKMKMGHR